MRLSSSIQLVAALVGGTVVLGGVLSACYNPDVKPNAFSCDNDAGGLCPSGFTCNMQSLCVRPGAPTDMLTVEFDLAKTGDLAVAPRTCDQRVQAGAFSNLAELKALNTSGDESHLSFDATGHRLVFQRGSALFSSDVSADLKSPGAPTAITISGAPATLNGGSFTANGHYWFSGTSGGTTALYEGTPSGSTFSATAMSPTASCAFSDPVFSEGSTATKVDLAALGNGLFIAYPLSGCGGESYIARGSANLDISSFYSALVSPGFQAPTMTSTGLTLMISSTGSTQALYTAARSDVTYQFGSPIALDMTGVGGAGTKDVQMVVSDDCSVAYFVSQRTGGTGGQDIWAADIARK